MATFNNKSEGNTRLIYEWILTASENGMVVKMPEYSDKSYAMWGTFGGTVTLQGSWDPVAVTDENDGSKIDANSWHTLRESDNQTEIANTAKACGVVLENPIWMRAIAGTGVTSVKIVVNASPRK